MSFGSSKAATPAVTAPAPTALAASSPVLQAATSPAAQPVVSPPPIPLPPPAANTPTLGSSLNQPGASNSALAAALGVGQFTGEGTIATSPQGVPGAPQIGRVTLLGK